MLFKPGGCDLGQDKLDKIKKHVAAEYMGEELAEYNKLVEELINMSKDLNQNQIVQFKLNLDRSIYSYKYLLF